MSKLTFLNKSDLLGTDNSGKEQLNVIRRTSPRAGITDFAILLGGEFSDNDINKLNDRKGCYWTKNFIIDVDVISPYGSPSIDSNWRRIGGRPATSFEDVKGVTLMNTKYDEKIKEIEYGYYPRNAVSRDMQIELEVAQLTGKLNLTGNSYITDSRKWNEYDKDFLPQKHIEYEYNGKRYVKVKSNTCWDNNHFLLSNGEKYRNNSFIWVEVEPVKWLVDIEEKIMITKEIIFAGVQFDIRKYNKDNFSNVNIKQFMDKYLFNDLFQPHSEIINTNSIADEYSKLIEKLYREGYSIEKIREITNDTLNNLSNTTNKVHQKILK